MSRFREVDGCVDSWRQGRYNGTCGPRYRTYDAEALYVMRRVRMRCDLSYEWVLF